MQLGGYVCFDEELSAEDISFIKRFNSIFSGQSGPKLRIIYKPFNRIAYESEGEPREDYDPDLPDFKYSLGWKVTMPEIPENAPEGLKRVARKIGIIS